MKEIKFRAWDKDNQRMVNEIVPMPHGNGANKPVYDNRNVRDVKWIVGGTDSVCKKMWEPWHIPNCIVMQYTGLKDKNGKEIYEGDVINANITEHHLPTMGSVVFDDHFLFYANKNEAGNTPLFKLDQIEIIGNIYENPEFSGTLVAQNQGPKP